MSVFTALLSSAIIGAGQGTVPGSKQLPAIAQGTAQAIASWAPIPLNVLAQGLTSGLSGAGSTKGKMFMVGSGLMMASFKAAGMNGNGHLGIAQAVEFGMLLSFNAAATFRGLSVGVSSGVDANKVTLANAGTLIPLLIANFQGVRVGGATSAQLATGIGNGTSALFLTSFGIGGVSPLAPAPLPGVGTSISIVL